MKLFFALFLLVTFSVFAAPVRVQNHTVEYVYDFAKSGGAVSVINLASIDGFDALPVGAIVENVKVKVVTAFTSTGSATLTWGTAADADGFSGSAVAVASLVDNYLSAGSNGELVTEWIETTPAVYLSKPYLVTSGNGQSPVVEIAGEAMTAGKALFVIDYYMPSVD